MKRQTKRPITGLLCLLAALLASPTQAVLVDYVPETGETTLPFEEAPVDDRGWARTPENRSAVYLGNQWVLTATHAGVGSLVLPSGTHQMIPGSDIILSNPSSFDGKNLSSNSDLRMYRIDVNESGLRPEDADPLITESLLPIATSAPTLGTQVTAIGRGRGKWPTGPSTDENGRVHLNSSFSHVAEGSATWHGYDNRGSSIKRWGSNKVARDSLFESGSDSDNVFVMDVLGRDIIGQVTHFDNENYFVSGQDTPEEFEFQAVSGDSGGPVFFDDNGVWTLAGVLHAVSNEDNQPGRFSLFGNLTIFTDLSQSHYRDQITALLADDYELFESVSGVSTNLSGYSINGDVNLDGVVSGDGTGDIATDDIAAFVDGWLWSQAEGDINSWKRGDLNIDGRTDLADFALMRQALGGAGAGSLEALLGVTAVPEPSVSILIFSAWICLWIPSRRR